MTSETVQLGSYHITIDTTTGELVGLRRGEGPQAVGHGDAPPLFGAQVAHRLLEETPTYRSHRLEGSTLTIASAVGPLRLADHLTLADDVITRRVSVQNTSAEEVQLTGVTVGLRGVSLGDPAACRFEAPANVLRPRLPLAIAASWPAPSRSEGQLLPGPAEAHTDIAPGADLVWGRALGDAPDIGPGLLIVHNPAIGWSLLTWYYSTDEAARPWVSGDGVHATLGYDMGLAGWLAPGASLQGGTQLIMLHQGTYEEALAAYRRQFPRTGVLPPVYEHVDRAADWVGLYEVHPGQYGGFDGLRKQLKRIQTMGIDTLYLMPIHPHRNKKNTAWDGNWEGVGSPYAILDFERLDPTLGAESAFRELVKTAHDLGMRVLVDLVLQGCALEASYVTEHPDWFVRDEQGDMVHSHGWNDTWSFDWANPGYQAFVLRYATDLVKRYDIDGFRVDAPHGKEPNWSRDIPYHASKTNLGASKLLEDLRRALLEIKPEAALYCELFGPMWINSHDVSNDYHPYAMAYALAQRRITPAEFSAYLADYWAVIPPGSPRVCFTETHDTRDWPAYALRGSLVSQALLGILVMSGFTPMIFAGQEDGQEKFIGGLMLARRRNAVLRRGVTLFDAVTVDDLNHYRRGWGDPPADWVYTVLRHDEKTALFGVASLYPERVTYRFGLPVDRLPIRHDRSYHLRDLISYEYWMEYGQDTWTGAELASLKLTPHMYRPYIFRLEEIDGA
ncbi:MAG: alpha-amylase family glycosyl hydrolase [Anaerolineae bacterium]